MTTEHEMAMAIATEIGKQVPVKQVYEDTTSPAAKQIGATFEDVIKCIRLVGFPIQWLAVQQDRFRSFLDGAKAQVPEQRLVYPAPQILGPILEGVRYEISDTPAFEMFQSLLARSMDSERVNEAHPSFPSIIKSLSPDEARILHHLRSGHIDVIFGTPGIVNLELYSENQYLLRSIIIDRPDLTNMYMEHLFSLSLLGWDHSRQETVEMEGRSVSRSCMILSLFGTHFMAACSTAD